MNGCVIILKTKIVNIRWNPKNKKWYESKGYTYTKMGDEFEVKVEDLTERSHVRIEVQCDNEECKTPILKPIIWSNYKIDTKEDGKYYCHPCSMILYGTEKTIFAKLETGKKIEGLVKVNKVGSKMKIIEYINHENIIVSFENGGIVNCSYGNFKKGAVKNPMDLLVSGVGYIGCGETMFQDIEHGLIC